LAEKSGRRNRKDLTSPAVRRRTGTGIKYARKEKKGTGEIRWKRRGEHGEVGRNAPQVDWSGLKGLRKIHEPGVLRDKKGQDKGRT